MRTLAVLATLALATLAGCISDGDGSDNPLPGAVIPPADYVVPMVPSIDAVALLQDHAAFVTEHNERADNKPTHESSRVAMLEMFESYGLETYRQNFTAGGLEQSNIMGIKWGLVRDEWVVVGGHYDTTTDDCLVSATPSQTPGTDPVPPQPVPSVDNPCPLRAVSQGAYDDGSGIMMTLHLAKAFANLTPYYTMAFVAYDGEERGTQGAGAFVSAFITGGEDGVNFTTPYGQVKARGVVDLDMVGINWPGTMAPMNILTNSEAAYGVADDARVQMGWPDEQWIRKDGLKLGSSDYARFWSVDNESNGPIPTIFFISDFEEVGLANLGDNTPPGAHTPTSPLPLVPFGAYPFWHVQDTVETMTAMAGGEEQLIAGFQSAVDIAAIELHAMACIPTLDFDAVPK